MLKRPCSALLMPMSKRQNTEIHQLLAQRFENLSSDEILFAVIDHKTHASSEILLLLMAQLRRLAASEFAFVTG